MAIFKILHGDPSNVSLDVTPFHEGYCYVTHDGYFYVDLNIGTKESPNNQRLKLNAKDAETLMGKSLDEIKEYVSVQSDWAQTDETKSDYIKNKPDIDALQPKTDETLETLSKTVVGAINEVNSVSAYLIGEITEGLSYTLSADGTYYICSGMGTSTATEIVVAPVYNGLPVKEIGVSAFNTKLAANSAAKELTSVIIPEGVEVIGDDAFRECKKLVSASLPNTLTTIGIRAFYSCEKLVDIEIPDNVTTLSQSAFNSCKALTSITIGEALTTIGVSAFQNCYKLEKIYFNATNMQDLIVEGGKDNYIFTDIGSQSIGGVEIIVGKNVNRLPAYFMRPGNTKLPKITSMVFEEGCKCTEIGSYAFQGCITLTTLELPENLKIIGNNAFNGCTNLSKIFLNAVSMDDCESTPSNYIFTNAGSTSATGVEVIISKNVTRIPGHLFHPASTGAPVITAITFEVDSKCETIGEGAFSSCSVLKRLEIPETIKTIGPNAFNGCKNLTSLIFNATNMNDLVADNNVFADAGESVEELNIVIGKNVQHIPNHLLHPSSDNPTNATSVSFEEGSICEVIGEFAFCGCRNLATIEIPEKIRVIKNNAFNGCTYLSEIFFNAIAMEDLQPQNFVFVNAGHLEGHEVDVKIGQDVTRIPTHIFHPNADTELAATNRPPNIAHVRFEENSLCETIGEHTFSNCPTLLDINIPHGVKTIGKNAFASCTNLTRITIPDSVTTIIDYAFYNCTKLEYIEIPDSVLTIGKSALRDCHKLKHVRLPNKLTVLAKSMFEKTSDKYASVTESIESVIIPKSVTTIELEVFLNAVSLRDIYYTGTEEEWRNIAIDSTVDEPNNDIDYLPMATIHYNFADDFVAVNEKIDNISVAGGGLPTDGATEGAFLRFIGGKPTWDPIHYAEGNRF